MRSLANAYWRALVITALLVPALVGAVNWFADPLAVFGGPWIEGVNTAKHAIHDRRRLFKTVSVVNGDWEALILGTSRADAGFDAQHPFFEGRRTFNAATGGETYEESLMLFEASLKRGHLRQILLVLDFPMSNAHVPPAPDFTAENFGATRKAKLAFSWDVLMLSIGTLTRQDYASMRRHLGAFQIDGRYVPPDMLVPREQALKSEESYLRHNYYPWPALAYAREANGNAPMRHVARTLRVAHQKEVRVDIVIAPSHARQWQTLVEAGLWEAFEDWKRELVRINSHEAAAAGRSPFPLWDFSGFSMITTEPFPPRGDKTSRMKWYLDSSHFTREAGDVVLHRLRGVEEPLPGTRDFGVRLTPHNIEDHLRDLAAQREAWAAANPLDAGEIAAMGAEARRYRERRALEPTERPRPPRRGDPGKAGGPSPRNGATPTARSPSAPAA